MDIGDIRASFSGKAQRTLSLSLLEEDYEAAIALFSTLNMEPGDGFAVALATGIASMKRPDTGSPDQSEQTVKELNRLEGAFIGMKNKAFLLSQDNERMELARNGWMVENMTLRQRVSALMDQLNALGNGPPAPQADPQPGASEPPTAPLTWDKSSVPEDRPGDDGRSLWSRLTGGRGS